MTSEYSVDSDFLATEEDDGDACDDGEGIVDTEAVPGLDSVDTDEPLTRSTKACNRCVSDTFAGDGRRLVWRHQAQTTHT